MRMEKLTSKFQMALAAAQGLAVGRDHQFIEPVHLMTALLDQEGGSIRHRLTQADYSDEGMKTQAKKTLPPKSIIGSCIGTVGAVALNGPVAQTNQQINAIVPRSDSIRYWAFFMSKELKPLLKCMGGGATMANVNIQLNKARDLLLPRLMNGKIVV